MMESYGKDASMKRKELMKERLNWIIKYGFKNDMERCLKLRTK